MKLMKKIFSIITLCLCTLLVACSDEEAVTSSLQVVATDGIDFSAASGEGTITVSATGTVTATSNKEWCTTTVEGNVVHVAVTTSLEVTSRIAVVTISAGTSSVDVPVVQAGLFVVLDDYNLYYCCGYDGGEFDFSFKTNTSYSVEVPEEAAGWLTYTFDADNKVLQFNVAASADKTPRGAEVKLLAGTEELVISLSQIEVSLDMIGGNWDMSYFSGAYGQEIVGTGQIGLLSDNLILMDALQENYLPLEIGENGILSVPANVAVGSFSGYTLKTATALSGGYYSLDVPCIAVPKVKGGKLIYHFGHCSAYTDGQAVDYPMIYAFAGSSVAGYWEYYENLEISKPLE